MFTSHPFRFPGAKAAQLACLKLRGGMLGFSSLPTGCHARSDERDEGVLGVT